MNKENNDFDLKYGCKNTVRTNRRNPNSPVHDILNNSENNNVVLYNPDLMVLQKCITLLLEEISKQYDVANKVVIVSSGLTLFNFDVYKANVGSTKLKKTIVTTTKLALISTIYSQIIDDTNKFPTSIIFDNVNNAGDLKNIIMNSYTFENNFKHVLLTTSSPSIFLNLIEQGKMFLPVFYDGHKYFDYFRRYKDKIKLVEYKNVEEEVHLDEGEDEKIINSKFSTLSQFINDLRAGSISNDMFDGDLSVLKLLGDRIMFLLDSGIYDSKFVINIVKKNFKFDFIRKHLEELEYKSNKLSKLLNLINEELGIEQMVVFRQVGYIRVICSILELYYPNSQVIRLDENGTKINLRNREKDLNLILLDINEYSLSNNMTSCVVFFDLVQMNIADHMNVFVTSKEREYLFNQLEKEEELAKTDLVNNILGNLNTVENATDIDHSIKFDNERNDDVLIRFHTNLDVSFPDKNDIKMITEDFRFTIKEYNSKPPHLRLLNNYNLSYFGVYLASFLKYAVEVDNFEGYIDNFSIFAESIAFGTITTFNLFEDIHIIEGKTLLLFRNDSILLYCINNLSLIKVVISNACMEKYIMIDKIGLIIDVYFCIGRRPNIYTTEISNTKIEKLKRLFKTKERYDFLEDFQWNRASLNEVPFLYNRNDIKISINFKNNQDQQQLKNHIRYFRNNFSKNRYEVSKPQKIELYDLIDVFVTAFKKYSSVKVLFSRFKREVRNTLSTLRILEEFKNLDFPDYYYVVCLLTQKGRFFNYNLDLEDCNYIRTNVKVIVLNLINRVNTRFMNIKKILEETRDNETYNNYQDSHLMRNVIVTPMSIVFKLPISFDKNRVLREFDHDKFLRVSLRDEDMSSKVKDSTMKNQNMVYDYYRKILFDGIFIGRTKYFFLAMTTSQMRLHSAWFVTPYFHNGVLIGSDYIRNWLGDFSEIKNIGKYAIRLGQALSSTIATINVENFIEVCDIERNGYNFSDGIGLISFSSAKEIANILRIDHIPSVFQIRFAGFKGVVGVHPIVDQDKNFVDDDINFNECKDKLMMNLNLNALSKTYLDNKSKGDSKRAKMVSNLLVRPSMNKFESNHRTIEVVAYAACQPCYLNRQYIMLLEGLGVDISIFLEFHDNYLFNHLTEIYERPNEYIKKHFGLFPSKYNLKNSKIYRKLIISIFNKHIKEFYKKNRILVKKGCVLMGGLDELGVLEKDEVFMRVKKDSVEYNEGFIIEDNYVIVVGPVLVMKNPCLHPGDIRTVMAVNKPELKYMRNVLVFNQKGERPLPNMCSGSDLDGDMYTVIWDSSLLPKKSYAPSEYKGLIVLNKEIVSSNDIVNFYIRYIRNYHLGSIAHAHLVQCDIHSVKHENSIFLAELFNRSIDFPKTGFMAVVPETLMPEKFPDFMESKFKTYPSLKTVGVLFRRSLDLQIVRKLICECKKCVENIVERFPKIFKEIIEHSNVTYGVMSIDPPVSEKSLILFNEYKRDMRNLLDKHGYQREELAFLNYVEEEGISEEILVDFKKLFNRYKSKIYDLQINQKELFKLSEGCKELICSIPIVFQGLFFSKEKIFLRSLFFYKHSEDRFILNSAITIKYFGKEEPLEIKFLRKNEVYVECYLYNSLLQNINNNNHQICKDIFDLLFIGGFFEEKSFDLVCLFFKYFIGKINNEHFDRLTICRILLEISREFYFKAATLPFCHFVNREIFSKCKNRETKTFYRASFNTKNNFHVKQKYTDNNGKVKIIIDNLARILSTTASLLVLPSNFLEKALHIYFTGKNIKAPKNIEQNPANASESKQGRKKIESYSHLTIKGMFDNSDELKLETYLGPRKQSHSQIPLYMPKLLNKGYCDSETYKDNFREFFINIFLGGMPDLSSKDTHLGMLVQMMVTPGRFYFYNVNPQTINTILTVEKLKSRTIFFKGEMLLKNALKSYFFNYLKILEKKYRNDFIRDKKIVFDQKSYEYVFSFIKDNVRYQVYFEKKDDKFIPIRISKNKKLKGKAFLVEDDPSNYTNDVQFELSYEEIILEGNKNAFNDEEKILFSQDILFMKNGKYVVNNLFFGARQFRFEINSMLDTNPKENYPFTLSSRVVYTPKKTLLVLDNKTTRLAVYSLISRVCNLRKDLKQFIDDFDYVWNCYKTYYC